MRVGILIGQPASLDPVRAVTLPFNINAVAIAATLAALEDPSSCPATPRRSASRAGGSTRPAHASGSSTGRAPPITCWSASATRRRCSWKRSAARKIHVRDRSKDPYTPRVHSHHRWRDRAHRRCRRGARIGHRREGRPMRTPGIIRSPDDRDADPRPPGASTARAVRRADRHPLLRSHAGAVRAARRLRSDARRQRAISTSISTTPSKTSASSSARRVEALGDRKGHQPRRLLRDADGRDARRSRRSIWAAGRTPWSIRRCECALVGDLQTELVHDFFDGFAHRRPRQRARRRCCTAAPATTTSKRCSRRSPARCASRARGTRGWRRCCRAPKDCCDAGPHRSSTTAPAT